MSTKCPNCGAENSEYSRFCGNCALMLIPSSPASGQYGPAPQVEPYKLRVNVFCVVGAMIAVFSLFLPWAIVEYDNTHDRTELWIYDFDRSGSGIDDLPGLFGLSFTFFLIGTAIAFFSPLGSIPMLMGSVGFMLTLATSEFENAVMIPYAGAGMAVIAAGAVVAGLFSPIGPGYSGGKGSGIASTLLAWGVFR